MTAKLAVAVLLVACCLQGNYAKPRAWGFDSITNTITGGFNSVKEAASNAASQATNTIQQGVNEVTKFVTNAADTVQTEAQNLQQKTEELVQITQAVAESMSPSDALGRITSIVDSIEEKVTNFQNVLNEILQSARNGQGMDNPVAQAINQILSTIAQQVDQATGVGKDASECLTREIASLPLGVAGDASQCLVDLVTEFTQILRDNIELVRQGRELVNAFKTTIGQCSGMQLGSCAQNSLANFQSAFQLGSAATGNLAKGAQFIATMSARVPTCGAQVSAGAVTKVTELVDTIPACLKA